MSEVLTTALDDTTLFLGGRDNVGVLSKLATDGMTSDQRDVLLHRIARASLTRFEVAQIRARSASE